MIEGKEIYAAITAVRICPLEAAARIEDVQLLGASESDRMYQATNLLATVRQATAAKPVVGDDRLERRVNFGYGADGVCLRSEAVRPNGLALE